MKICLIHANCAFRSVVSMTSASFQSYPLATNEQFHYRSITEKKIRKSRKSGRWQDAISILNNMETLGQPIDLRTWNNAIAACGKAGKSQEAIMLLERMKNSGHQPDPVAYSAAIGACAKTCRWKEAYALLDEMNQFGPKPDVFCYSATIDALGKGGQWQQALTLLDQAREAGVSPNVYTYGAAMSAVAKAVQWKEAIDLLHNMQAKDNVKPNLYVFNACITACAKGGQYQSALQVFDYMKQENIHPDVITYGALLDALAHSVGDHCETALSFLREMNLHGISPDLICYNSAIHSCENGGRYDLALRLLKQMISQGLKPDVTIINTVMASCVKSGASSVALKLLKRLELEGSVTIYSYNIALNVCAQQGMWKKCIELLNEMKNSNINADDYSLDCVIRALGKGGEWKLGVQLLMSMETRYDVIPSQRHFCAAMDACARAGEAEAALRLLDYMGIHGIERPPHAWTAAMHALGRCGQWEAACDLLHTMQDENDQNHSSIITDACYNAAMAACARAGQWTQTMNLFREMLDKGYKPTETSYAILLSACQAADGEEASQDKSSAQWRLAEMMRIRGIASVPIKMKHKGEYATSEEEITIEEKVKAMLMAKLSEVDTSRDIDDVSEFLGPILTGSQRAEGIMDDMKGKGLWPPSQRDTWNALIHAQENVDRALQLLSEMRHAGRRTKKLREGGY